MKPSLERTLRRFLKLPPVKWAKAAAKLDRTPQGEIAKAMENDAERLVLLSAYLGHLSYGSGEHASAQPYASKRLTKVRRAMGYTCPEQGLPSASW